MQDRYILLQLLVCNFLINFIYFTRIIMYSVTQEKRRVNTDPFLHRIYTIVLYTV